MFLAQSHILQKEISPIGTQISTTVLTPSLDFSVLNFFEGWGGYV